MTADRVLIAEVRSGEQVAHHRDGQGPLPSRSSISRPRSSGICMVVKNRGPVLRMRWPRVGTPLTVTGYARPALMSDACDSVASRTPGISLRRRRRSA